MPSNLTVHPTWFTSCLLVALVKIMNWHSNLESYELPFLFLCINRHCIDCQRIFIKIFGGNLENSDNFKVPTKQNTLWIRAPILVSYSTALGINFNDYATLLRCSMHQNIRYASPNRRIGNLESYALPCIGFAYCTTINMGWTQKYLGKHIYGSFDWLLPRSNLIGSGAEPSRDWSHRHAALANILGAPRAISE